MTEERRYGEDEVREIFGLAADDRARLPAAGAGSGSGLTLAELREIGREVGLAPERIDAAASLVANRPSAMKERTYLGLPIAVGRSVPLPRPLTDTEWEIVVGELRETFGARGRVRSQGGLREWVNGNLHAFQETTEDGYRLRLQTTKGTAVTATRIGAGLLALAVVLMLVMVLTGAGGDLFAPIFLGGLGLAALGSNALVLPSWASRREEQMDYIAARARALMAPDRED
ncbi:MAG: hypothetical protein ACN0LA_09610 [Candidatus Longimicrobiales bacterium M2_2A_002]